MEKPVTLTKREATKARWSPSITAFGQASPERIAEIEARRSALAAMTPEQREGLALKRKQEGEEMRKSPRYGYIDRSYERTMSPPEDSESRKRFLNWLKQKGVSERQYAYDPNLIEEFRQFFKFGNK